MNFNLLKMAVTLAALAFSFSAQAEQISVSEYLDQLRAEFIKLQDNGDKEKLPLFVVSPIHVEMTVSAKKNANGKVAFYVIEAGGNYENTTTQKMSFDVRVGDPSNPFLTQKRQWFPWQSNQYAATYPPQGINNNMAGGLPTPRPSPSGTPPAGYDWYGVQ